MTTDAELGAAARSILAEWAPGVNDFQVANRFLVALNAPADSPDVARTKPRPIPELRYDPYSTVMHAFGEWLAGHLTAEDVCHRIRDVLTEAGPEPDRYWSCRVGPVRTADLPDRADESLRRAVTAVFRRVAGREPDVLESGWGHDG